MKTTKTQFGWSVLVEVFDGSGKRISYSWEHYAIPGGYIDPELWDQDGPRLRLKKP